MQDKGVATDLLSQRPHTAHDLQESVRAGGIFVEDKTLTKKYMTMMRRMMTMIVLRMMHPALTMKEHRHDVTVVVVLLL